MKNYKRLTKWGKNKITKSPQADLKDKRSEPIVAITRLAELEDKIERGEIDEVSEKNAKIARLTAENVELRTQLEKQGFSYKEGDKIYIIKDEEVYEKTISEVLFIFEYHSFDEPYTHLTLNSLLYNLGKTMFTDPNEIELAKEKNKRSFN